MSESSKPVEILESQITEISDTHMNLVGLIEKAARVQAELLTAGFQEFSDSIGEPFSAMSTAAEKLQQLVHTIEIERNQIRNEE